MANFRETADRTGSIGKGGKWIAIIIVILIAVVFVKRDMLINAISSILERTNDEFEAKLSEDFPTNLTELVVKKITADSTLISSQGIEYGAENLIDGDFLSSWQEGEEGFGENCEISITLDKKSDIGYIVILNGNQLSEEKYFENNRPKEILLTIGDNSKQIELEDTMTPQVIEVSGSGKEKEIAITILSVYEGSKWNDTCVSEIIVYSK